MSCELAREHLPTPPTFLAPPTFAWRPSICHTPVMRIRVHRRQRSVIVAVGWGAMAERFIRVGVRVLQAARLVVYAVAISMLTALIERRL